MRKGPGLQQALVLSDTHGCHLELEVLSDGIHLSPTLPSICSGPPVPTFLLILEHAHLVSAPLSPPDYCLLRSFFPFPDQGLPLRVRLVSFRAWFKCPLLTEDWLSWPPNWKQLPTQSLYFTLSSLYGTYHDLVFFFFLYCLSPHPQAEYKIQKSRNLVLFAAVFSEK